MLKNLPYWTYTNILLQQLARVKAEVRKREESIKEKQQFLDNEIENNTEQEKKISIAERTAARIRSDYQEAETQRVQFQDEVKFLEGYQGLRIDMSLVY